MKSSALYTQGCFFYPHLILFLFFVFTFFLLFSSPRFSSLHSLSSSLRSFCFSYYRHIRHSSSSHSSASPMRSSFTSSSVSVFLLRGAVCSVEKCNGANYFYFIW